MYIKLWCLLKATPVLVLEGQQIKDCVGAYKQIFLFFHKRNADQNVANDLKRVVSNICL